MNSEIVEREILSLATEDYQGLWEVRSHIEKAGVTPGQDAKRAATKGALSLHQRGWIEIFEGSLLEGSATPLAREQAIRILQDPASWNLPRSNTRQLLIGATPEGEQAHLSRTSDPVAV